MIDQSDPYNQALYQLKQSRRPNLVMVNPTNIDLQSNPNQAEIITLIAKSTSHLQSIGRELKPRRDRQMQTKEFYLRGIKSHNKPPWEFH